MIELLAGLRKRAGQVRPCHQQALNLECVVKGILMKKNSAMKLKLAKETFRDLAPMEFEALILGGVTDGCTQGTAICTATVQCSVSGCATGGSARC
jgi:hypothetical protein